MKLRNPIITDKIRCFYDNGWTNKEVRNYLADHFCIDISMRTLLYWKKNLKDSSWKHPVTPNPPKPVLLLGEEVRDRIVSFRKKTGFGSPIVKKVFNLDVSISTIKRLIKKEGLSRGSKIENKRIHWVKWQRDHPDSLWQMDGTKDVDNNWILPVIDDCSRYCLGMKKFNTLTTNAVTKYLEELLLINGKPREILTDNGTEFGGIWKNNSEFDTWCNKQEITHIRSRVHKPTTAGKVERFHGTFKKDIIYCKGDMELFRYRYNQIRPHQSLHMRTPAEVYFSLPIRIKGFGFNQSKW